MECVSYQCSHPCRHKKVLFEIMLEKINYQQRRCSEALAKVQSVTVLCVSAKFFCFFVIWKEKKKDRSELQ